MVYIYVHIININKQLNAISIHQPETSKLGAPRPSGAFFGATVNCFDSWIWSSDWAFVAWVPQKSDGLEIVTGWWYTYPSEKY